MMQIAITEKLKPFCHEPGTSIPIPGTYLAAKIFPALILIYDISKNSLNVVAEINVSIMGPVSDFTVQLDLEKRNIHVFGRDVTGYFCYKIIGLKENGFLILLEKAKKEIAFDLTSLKWQFKKDGKNHFFYLNDLNQDFFVPDVFERLSLGNHKEPNWTLIEKRQDLKEIFPIWFRLGQLMPKLSEKKMKKSGTLSLFNQIEELIKKRDIVNLLKQFQLSFYSSFESLMLPTLIDSKHQGLHLPEVDKSDSLISLLTYGSSLIRSLFLTVNDKTISVLPTLPVEFHSGKFLHLNANSIGTIDLEWSKKLVRRMVLFAKTDAIIEIKWQKDVKRYRLKEDNIKATFKDVKEPIKIGKGKIYYFDRFQK